MLRMVNNMMERMITKVPHQIRMVNNMERNE